MPNSAELCSSDDGLRVSEVGFAAKAFHAAHASAAKTIKRARVVIWGSIGKRALPVSSAVESATTTESPFSVHAAFKKCKLNRRLAALANLGLCPASRGGHAMRVLAPGTHHGSRPSDLPRRVWISAKVSGKTLPHVRVQDCLSIAIGLWKLQSRRTPRQQGFPIGRRDC